MSAERRRFPDKGVRWSVKRVQPSTSISSSGRSTSGSLGSISFRSRPLVDRVDAGTVDEQTVGGELRLGARVAFASEPCEQLGLLARERM
jgi:hypothetical protein